MVEQRIKSKIRVAEISSATFDLHEYGVNVRSREIYLHGWHGTTEEEFVPGMEYRMATKFIKNLHLLNNQSALPIIVHQHTCGGIWEHGMAIYDAIVASSAPVIMVAYAHARSMSSITLQAADLRVLMPNCLFMIHQGTGAIDDTVRGVLSWAEILKRDINTMMDIYAKRSSFGRAAIQAQMEKNQEWYLSADDAVAHDFADGVFGRRGFESLSKIRARKTRKCRKVMK